MAPLLFFSPVQVINKVGDQPFTKADEEVFSSYLQFCGIGLRNAHLYEKSQLEVKRNQVLLDLARMIFEEQSTIEHVVFRILTHTQSLIQCQRVQVNMIHFCFVFCEIYTMIVGKLITLSLHTCFYMNNIIHLYCFQV